MGSEVVSELCRQLEEALAIPKEDLTIDVFAKSFDRAIIVLALSERELADEFEAAYATIPRWRKGVTAPREAMRPIVLKHLLQLAKAKAA